MRAEHERRAGSGARRVQDTDQDLSLLFGTSTALFASMTGPAHVLEAANPAFFTAIGGGRRERTGVPLVRLMPEPQRAALARDLQTGLLLPDLPDVPGAQLAAFYHPAGEGLEVGGDFYDVFERDDGSWAFILGDVCGRGAMAATTTALVRHTARAVASLLDDPVDIVKAVDKALNDRYAHQNSGFVTLVYGHLTPAAEGLAVELVRGRAHVAPAAGRRPQGRHGRGIRRAARHRPAVPAHRPPSHAPPRREPAAVYRRHHRVQGRRHRAVRRGPPGRGHGSVPRGAAAADVVRAVAEDVRGFMDGREVEDDQAALVVTADRPAL